MTSGRTLVVSLGDSFFDLNLCVEGIRSLSKLFLRLTEKDYKVVTLVGPFSLGEEYSKVARNFKTSKSDLDRILIKASLVNAQLLIESLRSTGVRTNTKPFIAQDEISEFYAKLKAHDDSRAGAVAVLGSNQSGNRYAALVARKVHGRLVVFSSINDVQSFEC